MKKLNLLFVFIASMVLIFGCKTTNPPDENNNDNNSDTIPIYTSYLEYNNVKYELTQGFYQEVEALTNFTKFRIYLTSKEYSANSDASGLSGRGNAFVCDITLSGMFQFLALGSYTYDFIVNDLPDAPNQLCGGDIYINKIIDGTSSVGTLDKGKLTIDVKENRLYELNYSDLDSVGKSVKVHYEGTMIDLR